MNQDEIKKIIEDIFNHTGCSMTGCEFSDDNGMLWCSIETPDSRFLIGREGEALRSLNHLIHKMIEKKSGEPARTQPDKVVLAGADAIQSGGEKPVNLFIDINGYQKKRFENLKATAYMMAERARYFKSNIEVDPMPAYERRIIHLFLENAKDVTTESSGFGLNRKVVIKYTGNI